MQSIDTGLLALVQGGGDNTTRVGVGPFQFRSTQTDYSKCLDAAKDIARRQHPSTASWLPWSRDTNAGPRAAAEAQNIKTLCGTPPR